MNRVRIVTVSHNGQWHEYTCLIPGDQVAVVLPPGSGTVTIRRLLTDNRNGVRERRMRERRKGLSDRRSVDTFVDASELEGRN